LIECDFASSGDGQVPGRNTRLGGEQSFDNLRAVVSPNIYVTGSGGSTKWVAGEGAGRS
jgi:hypothetical protein